MSCPRCSWPEWTPYRVVKRIRRDALGRLLSALVGRPVFQLAGSIARCTKCAEEYVIGRDGCYQVEAGREPPVMPATPPAGDPRKPIQMADADLRFD